MNLTPASSARLQLTGNSSTAKPVFTKNAAKNDKAARDFEAMLLTPLLDALEKTFAGTTEDATRPGANDYRLMASGALAQAIAARGGIGIAELVLHHLQAPKVPGGNGTGV